jgi:hypothetical protein
VKVLSAEDLWVLLVQLHRIVCRCRLLLRVVLVVLVHLLRCSQLHGTHARGRRGCCRLDAAARNAMRLLLLPTL